jgi:hypothetical protein
MSPCAFAFIEAIGRIYNAFMTLGILVAALLGMFVLVGMTRLVPGTRTGWGRCAFLSLLGTIGVWALMGSVCALPHWFWFPCFQTTFVQNVVTIAWPVLLPVAVCLFEIRRPDDGRALGFGKLLLVSLPFALVLGITPALVGAIACWVLF